MEYLFVYGTLRNSRKGIGVPVGEGTITGTLLDFGAFPGLVLKGTTSIIGDLIALTYKPKTMLSYLDRYENVAGGLFAREKVTVTLKDGRIKESWVYVFKQDTKGYPIVKSGDWLKHIR